MTTTVLVAVGLFVALLVGMQLVLRAHARAMQGQPVPSVPGPIGQRLAASSSALVYFMSPSCGACRPWTPKFERLGRANRNVFIVDVTQNLDVAQALRVMATPSVVEIRDGRIAGYHVGGVPSDVLNGFSAERSD